MKKLFISVLLAGFAGGVCFAGQDDAKQVGAGVGNAVVVSSATANTPVAMLLRSPNADGGQYIVHIGTGIAVALYRMADTEQRLGLK